MNVLMNRLSRGLCGSGGLTLSSVNVRPMSNFWLGENSARRLTGIWNAAVRGAVVARLRASGLPADDLLLRLQALSPTLGFQSEKREWARQWMADPTAQDGQLVQQCLVRLLLAIRGLAEARARFLTDSGSGGPA